MNRISEKDKTTMPIKYKFFIRIFAFLVHALGME